MLNECIVEIPFQSGVISELYILLFSFSLIYKADAVNFFNQLAKGVVWCFKTKETDKHSTVLLPKYFSLAKPVTFPLFG